MDIQKVCLIGLMCNYQGLKCRYRWKCLGLDFMMQMLMLPEISGRNLEIMEIDRKLFK